MCVWLPTNPCLVFSQFPSRFLDFLPPCFKSFFHPSSSTTTFSLCLLFPHLSTVCPLFLGNFPFVCVPSSLYKPPSSSFWTSLLLMPPTQNSHFSSLFLVFKYGWAVSASFSGLRLKLSFPIEFLRGVVPWLHCNALPTLPQLAIPSGLPSMPLALSVKW